MKLTHYISQDYRDRWSELPKGEFELLKGDKVELINNPGIGSIHVRKEDGTDVFIAGFSGNILNQIPQDGIEFSHPLWPGRSTWLIPNQSYIVTERPLAINWVEAGNLRTVRQSGISDAGLEGISFEKLKELGY
jgi:hypothetical protein